MKNFINRCLNVTIIIALCLFYFFLEWFILTADIIESHWMFIIFVSIPIAGYFILIRKKDIAEKTNTPEPSGTTDDKPSIPQNTSSDQDKHVYNEEFRCSGVPKIPNTAVGDEITIEKEIVNKLTNLLISLNSKMQTVEDSLESTNSLRVQKEILEKSVSDYINGYNFSVLKIGINDFIDAYEFTSNINNRLEQNTGIDRNQTIGYINAISSYLQQGLEIVSVEQFSPEIGSLYQKQAGAELVEKVMTEDKTKIGTIAKTLKPGWITKLPDDDSKRKILRKALVGVYTQSE